MKTVRSAMAVAVTVVGLGAAVPGAARAAPLSVHATTQPSAVGIGDAFTYVIDVRVDPALVDARSVTVVADGGPFAPLGDQIVSRSSTSVRLEQRLACLGLVLRPARRQAHGDPAAGPRARSAARRRKGGGGRSAAHRRGRRAGAGRRGARRRAPPTASRRHSHRRTRGRAGVAISAGTAAALLVVASLGLAAVATRRRRRAAPPWAAEEPLARALRLLRESASRGAPDRRRAADLLARVARTRGAPPLADEATRVAWSPEQPQPATATALADKADKGAGR